MAYGARVWIDAIPVLFQKYDCTVMFVLKRSEGMKLGYSLLKLRNWYAY